MSENKDLLPEMLKGSQRRHGFRTPPGYFENLADQIMDQVESQTSESNTRIISLRSLWKFGVAASIAIAIVIWWPRGQQAQEILLAEDFTGKELADYVVQHLDEFDLQDLYLLAPEMDDPVIADLEVEEEELHDLLDDLLDDVELQTIHDIL